MPDVIALHEVRLTPVIELEPWHFSTDTLKSPPGTVKEKPTEWHEYWLACLADSEITGICPIQPGSWHVSTASLTQLQLEKILHVIIGDWGGMTALSDPDTLTALYGGLVLSANDGTSIAPNCCGDLSDIDSWKAAASFRKSVWEILWIGHPWLSMKYQQPNLILSDVHESNSPVERWTVQQDELQEAVHAAEAELLRFTAMIASILAAWNYKGDPTAISMQLAGIPPKASP